MAYYALLTAGYVGHLNPMSVLARALMRRQHRVVMIAPLDAEERIRRAGVEFLPIGEVEFPKGEWERRAALQGELVGFAASRYVGKWLADCARAFVRELPGLIERERFDGMVIDQISIGADAVCQAVGMPMAVACCALALNPEWGVAPVTSNSGPATGLLSKIRNALEYAAWNSTGFPVAFAVGRYRRRHRLGQMQPSHMNQMKPSLVQVAQQPAAFDFPREYLPKHFHYTGPWKEDGVAMGGEDFPWDRLTERPLIYASLGTLQNRLDYLFRMIADACVGLDAQLVIALGRKTHEVPKDFPGNPIVVGYAPQMELLKLATMVITHGGMNTTLEALREGCPMVALPITNDQPGVAVRLEHLGLGERVLLKGLTVEKLRAAVTRVLKDEKYSTRAQAFAAQMQKVDGPAMAAELIERAFVTKKTVTREGVDRIKMSV